MNKNRDKEYLKRLGNHLKSIRIQKHLSQEKLANLAEISDTQIARIERGEVNPTICTLKVIASALEVELFKLLMF